MAKEQITVKDLNKVIKFSSFIEQYTSMKPTGGIKHRVNGYGTSAHSKTTGLTNNDKIELKKGYEALISDIQEAISNLGIEEENDQV